MRQRRIWHSPSQEATRRERSGREQSPATPTELPESRPASCPPYKMTFSSGTSAIQRPSTSRPRSIVSFIATAYYRWFRIADSERWPSISGAAGSGGCGRGPERDFWPASAGHTHETRVSRQLDAEQPNFRMGRDADERHCASSNGEQLQEQRVAYNY